MRLDAASRNLIDSALREDLGARGDITTRFFLPAKRRYRAHIVAKQRGILCGAPIVDEVFRRAAPGSRVRWTRRDGQSLRPGDVIARIQGPRSILSAERTALNFLQKLSGMATLTRAFVDKTRGTRARIHDTRKTPPGWRTLAKYAVRCGGGANHRMGLYDMALLKDNHLAGWATGELPKLAAKTRLFRKRYPRIPVEIEAKTHGQVETAVALGADLVLLDNMDIRRLRREISFLRERAPRIRIEISGGVNLATIGGLARLNPDRISVGLITHSAPALDISLELD